MTGGERDGRGCKEPARRHRLKGSLFLLLFFAGTGLLLYAQMDMTRRNSGGWGPWDPYARAFNPSTLRRIAGEVVSSESIIPFKGMFRGRAITVRTDKDEAVFVHLGPEWYLQEQNAGIYPGDRVIVSGSETLFRDRRVFIASEVVRDAEKKISLRNGTGRAAWYPLVPRPQP